MTKQLFTYLKRKKISNTRIINRLFVSIFVLLNNIKVEKNKLVKGLIINENDNDFHLLQELILIINLNHSNSITLEKIINLFEFVISPSDRIVTGAIYTPQYIRDKIITTCLNEKTIEQLEQIRIADISCGCGGFLIDAAIYLHEKTKRSFHEIFSKNIYGIDIQDYSVERTQILLSLLALSQGEDKSFNFNILQADTLDFKTKQWNSQYTNFNIIVGNPPYVCSRHVSEQTKSKFKYYEVCQSGHPDLYLPFFQIATEMLLSDGEIGFITMNSFIRSVNGRAVREYFSLKKLNIYIIDFRGHQIFQGKNTYTNLFFLNKRKQSDCIYYTTNETGNLFNNIEYTKIPYAKLDNRKGWFLNEFDKTCKLESVGIPISEYCQSRHGIATLSNKTYIFIPIKEDKNFYYLKDGNNCIPIEKKICKNVVNSNKLNSDVSFDNIIEKLIFPYNIKDNGKTEIINEHTMKTLYPYAYTYLKNKKEILKNRDKGRAESYPIWYAYGRTQSLVMPQYKLFFPKFANKPLHCILRDDIDLMLYNGIAFVSNSIEQLHVLKRILESKIFWEYIIRNAKPYASNYYSLSGVDIKNFGIPLFSIEEQKKLLSITKKELIDKWLKKFYN